MADGSHRAIEEVRVGDRVLRLRRAPHAAWMPATVTRTVVHPAEDGTGTFIVVNGSLRLTSNHPVWVDGHGKRADHLAVGDSIVTLTPDGRPVATPVDTLERASHREVTYDLDVDGPGNFVAGLVVVVHKIEQ